jgi:hypothetical protein
MCKCNCCKRGPQGIAGINSVVNVLTQDNIDVNSPISDAADESFLLSNGNRLVYLATASGRYRVSLQFKINNTAVTNHTVQLVPAVAVGLQTFPLGTPLNYLAISSPYTATASGATYHVFEFDVFLDANESIAIALSTSGLVNEVFLQDNLFLIDKIL